MILPAIPYFQDSFLEASLKRRYFTFLKFAETFENLKSTGLNDFISLYY
jgi:hypothetical protein